MMKMLVRIIGVVLLLLVGLLIAKEFIEYDQWEDTY